MIEALIQSGLTALLAQGTGWVIAVILGILLYLMFKRYECLNEKRFEELKTILDALNRSSDALGSMKTSVDARTEAINQLTGGFANLVRDMETGRPQWQEAIKSVSGRLEDIQRRLP